MATPARFRANGWAWPPHWQTGAVRTWLAGASLFVLTCGSSPNDPGQALPNRLPANYCVETEYNASGQLIERQGYAGGQLEGLQQQWYANGTLREERFYHANRKVGRHRGWWPNGNPRFEYTIQNDVPTGTHRDWFENGQLAALFTYAPNGQPEGRQTMWFADGQLRANYVVRQGRRFGLFGTKGCGAKGTM
jgi:hypothetical protein